jgi:hypothetical protein
MLKKKGTNSGEVAIIYWKIYYGVGICPDKYLVVVQFDPDLFVQYANKFNRRSRTFLTKAKDPRGYFEPTLCDMYKAGSSGGSRVHAVSYHFSSKASTPISDGPVKCCSIALYF